MNGKHVLRAAAGAAAAAVLVSMPRVAGALRDWQATRRQAALRAVRTAIDNGADAVDLSAFLDEDRPASGDARDDAEIRGLALAADVGPRPPAAHQYVLGVGAAARARWSAPETSAALTLAGATVTG